MGFINPEVQKTGFKIVESLSNCGSLTLDKPIKITRPEKVFVSYFDTDGEHHEEWFNRKQGSLTIQHEIQHNRGILITDL